MHALTALAVAVMNRLPRRSEAGASLVEYALLLALIAMVCMAAVSLLGGNTASSLKKDSSSLFG